MIGNLQGNVLMTDKHRDVSRIQGLAMTAPDGTAS